MKGRARGNFRMTTRTPTFTPSVLPSATLEGPPAGLPLTHADGESLEVGDVVQLVRPITITMSSVGPNGEWGPATSRQSEVPYRGGGIVVSFDSRGNPDILWPGFGLETWYEEAAGRSQLRKYGGGSAFGATVTWSDFLGSHEGTIRDIKPHWLSVERSDGRAFRIPHEFASDYNQRILFR